MNTGFLVAFYFYKQQLNSAFRNINSSYATRNATRILLKTALECYLSVIISCPVFCIPTIHMNEAVVLDYSFNSNRLCIPRHLCRSLTLYYDIKGLSFKVIASGCTANFLVICRSPICRIDCYRHTEMFPNLLQLVFGKININQNLV